MGSQRSTDLLPEIEVSGSHFQVGLAIGRRIAVASAIVAETSLSFLGLGVPPSIPTWRGVLAASRDYLRDAWWPVTFPGLAIMLTVLPINVVGDWLRDYLDPRLKR